MVGEIKGATMTNKLKPCPFCNFDAVDGSLGAGKYIEADQGHFIQMLRHGNIRIEDAHNFAIGWRYPVGDLG